MHLCSINRTLLKDLELWSTHPTKELKFELISPIMEVEECILAYDEDDEGVLAMTDDRPHQISRTSPKSLARL